MYFHEIMNGCLEKTWQVKKGISIILTLKFYLCFSSILQLNAMLNYSNLSFFLFNLMSSLWREVLLIRCAYNIQGFSSTVDETLGVVFIKKYKKNFFSFRMIDVEKNEICLFFLSNNLQRRNKTSLTCVHWSVNKLNI